MKVYLHWELQPQCTRVVVLEKTDERTIKELVDDFVDFYAEKHGSGLIQRETVLLKTQRKSRINLSDKAISVFKNGDDLFLYQPTKEENYKEEKGAESSTNPPLRDTKEPNSIKFHPVETQSSSEANISLKDAVNKLKEAKRYKNAIEICKQGLHLQSDDLFCLLSLGDIYTEIQKYRQAIPYMEKASKVMDNPLILIRLSECYCKSGEIEKSIAICESILSKSRDPSILRLTLLSLCESFIQKKMYQSALTSISRILEVNMEDKEALILYSIIMFHSKKTDETVKVLLRLLIQLPNNKEVQEYLAQALDTDLGWDYMHSELKGTAETAAAFAYLATITKDFGVIRRSVQLYTKACQLAPTSASYSVNLGHVLEVDGKPLEGYRRMMEFLKRNPSLQVGGTSGDAFYKALTSDFSLPPSPSVDLSKEYTKNELDLLSIFFTIAKILYLLGDFTKLKKVDQTLEVLKQGRDLHLTDIRNEQAYFACVHSLLEYHKEPVDPRMDTIYVLGDSHCLSPAWNTLTLKGKQYLLKPMLVTGMKMWHLRDESRFYTKHQFYQAVAQIPNNATVVVLFREIDCREGFLIAIQKAIYETLEEASENAINGFLRVMKKIQNEKKLKLFAHPVLPVLDVTRSIVRTFNKVYRERVSSEPWIQWLDFFEELLSPDGADFRKEYSLDGTHANPSYLVHLARSMNKAVS